MSDLDARAGEGSGPPAGPSEGGDRLSGRRVVLRLCAAVVAVAAAMGFLVGVIRPRGLEPVLFGVVGVPPTPLGTAAFGAITVGTGLAVALAAVVAASRYVEDA